MIVSTYFECADDDDDDALALKAVRVLVRLGADLNAQRTDG
jgi:hypothetical protein